MSSFDQRVCEWLNTATIPTNKKQTVLNRVSVSISNYRALEIDKAHPAAAAAAAAAAASASASASVAQTPRTPKAGGARGAGASVSTPKTPASPGVSSRLYKGRSVTSPTAASAVDNSPSRCSAAGGFSVPQLEVDYALQQRIAKALRRLQEGDEGDDANPLFAYSHKFGMGSLSNTNSPNKANEGGEFGDDGDAANNNGGEEEAEEGAAEEQQNAAEGNEEENDEDKDVDDENQPFGRPDNETGAYTVGFTFGDAPDDNFVGTHNGNDDDEDHQNGDEDNTMTEREDARRRLTMKRKSRNAISAETVDPEAAMAFTAEVVEKDPSMKHTIISSLETHHLFSHLDDDDLAFVADIMTIRSFSAGENIVTKMDPCDDMMIIVEGEAIVTDTVTAEEYDNYTNDAANKKATAISNKNKNAAAAAAIDIEALAAASPTATSSSRSGARLTVGKTFGELGLMYHTIETETIDAVDTFANTVVCCSLSRNAYKNICAKASKIKRERYEGFLANVKFLQGLTKEERLRLADALKSGKYAQGEKIIKYGEEGVWFNIILEGRVDVIGRDGESGAEVHVCSFKEGDSVGELEFIYGHKTVADCVAGTAVVKTAKMTANHFEKVIGPAKEVLERRANGDQVYSYYRQTNKVK